MKVLFATSEFADFAKAGGLGDVSAGLPRALRRRDIDVRVLLPAYPEVIAKANDIAVVAHLPGHAGIDPCCIGEARTDDGLILYLVLEPSLYQRTGSPYAGPEGHDWPDNDLRFARLSLAAAEIAAGRAGMSWQPDLLHVNDWPGGLAPAYLRWQGARVPTILTIHNIAYQGLCDRERMPLLGIPEGAFHINGVEFHDRVSFLKAGLFYAAIRICRITSRPTTCRASRRTPTWCAPGCASNIPRGHCSAWFPGWCTRRDWTSLRTPPATSCARAGRSPSWAWAIPTPSTC